MIDKQRDEARQAEPAPGHMSRHALIGGLVLVVVAFILAFAFLS